MKAGLSSSWRSLISLTILFLHWVFLNIWKLPNWLWTLTHIGFQWGSKSSWFSSNSLRKFWSKSRKHNAHSSPGNWLSRWRNSSLTSFSGPSRKKKSWRPNNKPRRKRKNRKNKKQKLSDYAKSTRGGWRGKKTRFQTWSEWAKKIFIFQLISLFILVHLGFFKITPSRFIFWEMISFWFLFENT